MLRQNGFEFDISDNSTVEDGHRLKLTAIPVSKGTVFDVKGDPLFFFFSSHSPITCFLI